MRQLMDISIFFRFLIDYGAVSSIEAYDGSTMLHLASLYRHLDVVKYLIKSGNEVDKENITGCTSLQYASFCGHLDVVKHLIENGADVKKEIIAVIRHSILQRKREINL